MSFIVALENKLREHISEEDISSGNHEWLWRMFVPVQQVDYEISKNFDLLVMLEGNEGGSLKSALSHGGHECLY